MHAVLHVDCHAVPSAWAMDLRRETARIASQPLMQTFLASSRALSGLEGIGFSVRRVRRLVRLRIVVDRDSGGRGRRAWSPRSGHRHVHLVPDDLQSLGDAGLAVGGHGIRVGRRRRRSSRRCKARRPRRRRAGPRRRASASSSRRQLSGSREGYAAWQGRGRAAARRGSIR